MAPLERKYLLPDVDLVFSGIPERFNDWGGRGYADFVPKEVTKTAPSGDRTT